MNTNEIQDLREQCVIRKKHSPIARGCLWALDEIDRLQAELRESQGVNSFIDER